MLFVIIVFECVSLLSVVAAVKTENKFGIVECFILIMTTIMVYQTTSLGQLVMSPKIQLSSDVTNASVGMLDCLGVHYPWIDTPGLKKCVLESSVYNISNGRIPYSFNVPVAFVVTKLFVNDIFIVDKYYSHQNDIGQALILIHECSHLILSTLDYAYRWQPEFKLLNDGQHRTNADSYVDVIVKKCLTDTDFSFW